MLAPGIVCQPLRQQQFVSGHIICSQVPTVHNIVNINIQLEASNCLISNVSVDRYKGVLIHLDAFGRICASLDAFNASLSDLEASWTLLDALRTLLDASKRP